MSDENNNNNNETSLIKANINSNDIDIKNSNNKNLLKLNTIDSSSKRDLLSNLFSSENMPSSKTLLDDEKTFASPDKYRRDKFA